MARQKRAAGGGRPRSADRTRFLTDRATERALRGEPAAHYVLRLYTAGSQWRSLRAVESVRRVCARCLRDRVTLNIIDLYQQPELALHDSVVAAPCLVRLSPKPRQIFIGDLTDQQRLLRWLGITDARNKEQNAAP